MILTIIEIILALVVPFLTIKFSNNWLTKKLGVVGTNYLLGIVYALIIFAFTKTNVITQRDTSGNEIISYLAVSFSIPFLLYNTNLRDVLKLSKKSLISFGLLIFSVICVTAITYFAFSKNIASGNILSGMAVGLYTGGTPNLNSIAYSFGLDKDTILMSNISDIIFGGLFYVFLILLAKPLIKHFLKGDVEKDKEFVCEKQEETAFSFKNHGVFRNILLTLGAVAISAGVGVLIWIITGKVDGTLTNYLVPALMLGTTVIGLMLSFNKNIREVKGNNKMGEYCSCVFSFAISSIIDFNKLSGLALNIFIHFAIITLATFLLHLLLCKIFKINADIMITTCTAGIYGPAFIPSVTKSIGAQYMLATGLILGSLGYAIGTFLGIGIAQLFTLF